VLPCRPRLAAVMTAASGGRYEVRDRWFGWQVIPAPGSSYPAVWAFTWAGLWRRLAVAATPSSPAER
jgi:hypothetical protein